MPAVELGAKGLLNYRAHAYREAFATPAFSATTMVVHSSHDTVMLFPSAVGSVYTLAWVTPLVSHVHARGLPRRALEREPARDSHDFGRVLQRFESHTRAGGCAD